MRYKAILFDLDDTLLKTSAVKWAHHKAVAKRFYDIDLTDEVLAEHWGKPFQPMMAIFYQNADTPENMLKANRALEDEFPKELQDEAIATVNALIDAHVEVGVITSIDSHLARKDLKRLRFPVEQFFIIQGADESMAHKPDPRVFDKALQMLTEKKIPASETLYVGDALMDYYAARDAGLGFLGVTTGFVTQQQFEEAGVRSGFSLAKLLED